MPPESLSTLAVMNPGPRTARNSSIRIRQRFAMLAGSYGGFMSFLTDHIRRGRGAETPAALIPWRSLQNGLTEFLYHDTFVLMYQGGIVPEEQKNREPVVVERVQTGVRMEKRLLKVDRK